MEDPHNISLVDNTSPTRHSIDDTLSHSTSTGNVSSHFSKRWTREERARRKYAKWQPQKLGIPDTGSPVRKSPSPDPDASSTTDGRALSQRESRLEQVDTVDFATSNGNGNGNSNGNSDGNGNGNENGNGNGQPAAQDNHTKPDRVLDILYENQRGWFFFGIPLYSHGSLLNFDPSAWVTQDLKDSPVNITNAQLPDPSWEWAWPTWYVDMSGDVDEQGWQYSLSFSSSAWHGNHPWFHSFVRRRRWVRMRNKKATERVRRGQTKLEKAHRLTEDYFTIHSSTGRTTTAASAEVGSQAASTLNRPSTKIERVAAFEEIADVPTLMYALKVAIVDREKIEALKRFIVDGGEELYYLDEKMPDIMALFVFQTSRWQLLTYLMGVVDELSQILSEVSGEEAEIIQRKRDNLGRAANTARNHIRGPDIFGDVNRASTTGMLDLSPVSKEDSLLAKHIGLSIDPIDRGKRIEGIPKEAEIGREGHIYRGRAGVA